MQKIYSEISSLKSINAIINSRSAIAIPIEKNSENGFSNLNVPKPVTRISSPKQLEPFINKLLNRDNFDGEIHETFSFNSFFKCFLILGVITVLQELEKCSQLQPFILNEFIHYLHDFLKDFNDSIREFSYSLVMRFLRLNPK